MKELVDAVATCGQVLSIAEDGLDPVDALTPAEALARIVWVLQTDQPVGEGYAGGAIQALLRWHAAADKSPAAREDLEANGWLTPWHTESHEG